MLDQISSDTKKKSRSALSKKDRSKSDNHLPHRRGQSEENPEVEELVHPQVVHQLGLQTEKPSTKAKYQTNIFNCPLEELKPKSIQSVMYKGEMILVVYPHCLWELIEHIKTSLNSKELFMNLQVSKSKVAELRQIYTKEGKCDLAKNNVSAAVASDLLAEWIKEIPGGLVSTQLYTFNFSLSKNKDARITEVSKLLNSLNNISYATLQAIVELELAIYLTNGSTTDILIQLSELAASIFNSSDITSFHIMVIMITNFRKLFNRFKPKEPEIEDLNELSTFLFNSSVCMIFEPSAEVDNLYTVVSGHWTYEYTLARFHNQSYAPKAKNDIYEEALQHNSLCMEEIGLLSDLSLQSTMACLQARQPKDMPKDIKELTPAALLREKKNSEMIVDAWRYQFFKVNGTNPTKMDDQIIGALIAYMDSLEGPLNEHRRAFEVYHNF